MPAHRSANTSILQRLREPGRLPSIPSRLPLRVVHPSVTRSDYMSRVRYIGAHLLCYQPPVVGVAAYACVSPRVLPHNHALRQMLQTVNDNETCDRLLPVPTARNRNARTNRATRVQSNVRNYSATYFGLIVKSRDLYALHNRNIKTAYYT